ncbi:MAG: PsbP-related protein [Methanosarcinales archaeon]
MKIQNKKVLAIPLIFLVIGIVAWFVYQYQQQEPENITGSPPDSEQNLNSTSTLKTYRNEEFGFEFQYPEGWSFHENTFYSPFSKFNLVGASPEESGRPDPLAPSLLINIVTPDFVDRAFYDLENIASEINVRGVIGSKYEYEYEGSFKIAIILPFGQYKIILGAYKVYEDIFNQILTSFKFLK